MDQDILNEAVDIATRSAILGNPIKNMVWVPPSTATQDPRGFFVIEYIGSCKATTEDY